MDVLHNCVSDARGSVYRGEAAAGGGGGGGSGFDISGATFDSAYTGIQGDGFKGATVSPDGTKMLSLRGAGATVYYYTLATGWDFTTVTYQTGYGYGGNVSPNAIQYSQNGNRAFIVGSSPDEVQQVNMITPYAGTIPNLGAGGTTTGGSVDISAQLDRAVGQIWTGDEVYCAVLDRTTRRIYVYQCSTAGDVSTASYTGVSSPELTDLTTPNGMAKHPNGSNIVISDLNDATIHQYTLSGTHGFSALIYDDLSLSVSAQDTSPTNMFFQPDGSRMFVAGEQNNDLQIYTL